MLTLIKGTEMRMYGLSFDDEEQRELKVAATVDGAGAWPFDGAVYSSETWIAFPGGRGVAVGLSPEELLESNSEYFGPDTKGDRDEALIVIALTAEGRSRCLIQPFGRMDGGIVYGELIDDYSGSMIPSFLSPIWRTWPRQSATSPG